MISSVRFKNTKKDWMSGVKPKDHVGPIADRDLLVPLTNKSIQENSSSFQMLPLNRRWMVKILSGICLFSILSFSFYLFYTFETRMPNTNNPSYEDPNLSAATAGQLLLTIPNKADVPKVRSWIVDVKKGKVLHEYTFEPVILLVWLDPKDAELLYSQNTAERKELSTLAADISVEYNNVFTTMSPEAQFPAGG